MWDVWWEREADREEGRKNYIKEREWGTNAQGRPRARAGADVDLGVSNLDRISLRVWISRDPLYWQIDRMRGCDL